MKQLTIIAIMASAMFAGTAFAEGAQSTATTASTSASQASNAGNTQGVSVNIEASKQRAVDVGQQTVDYRGSYTVKNVPSVGGPNLTTSNDTCMGSSSASANGPGVGVSFGTTWTDEHCKRLKMSRELWNKGMKAASLAMDCMDPQAKAALEMTGTKCPQSMTEEERQRAFSPVSAAPVATQPVASVAPSAVVTASADAIVTRRADGSTFVDLRTGK